MTSARKCDACGKIGEWPYFGWWKVEYGDDPEIQFWGQSSKWDACSPLCMKVMAEKQEQTK
jgi:hypothetical protein